MNTRDWFHPIIFCSNIFRNRDYFPIFVFGSGPENITNRIQVVVKRDRRFRADEAEAAAHFFEDFSGAIGLGTAVFRRNQPRNDLPERRPQAGTERTFYRYVRGMYQKLPVRVMTSDTGKSIRIPSRTASVVHQNPFSVRIYGTRGLLSSTPE